MTHLKLNIDGGNQRSLSFKVLCLLAYRSSEPPFLNNKARPIHLGRAFCLGGGR